MCWKALFKVDFGFALFITCVERKIFKSCRRKKHIEIHLTQLFNLRCLLTAETQCKRAPCLNPWNMKRISYLFAVLSYLILSCPTTFAGLRVWNPSGANPVTGGGAGVLRESGGINVPVTVWRTATSGGVMTFWRSSNADDADFRGTAGTMTMNNSAAISVRSLTFRADGYLFTVSAGSIVMGVSGAGPGTINVVTNGHTATYSGARFITIPGAVNSNRRMVKTGEGKFRTQNTGATFFDYDKIDIQGGTWEVAGATTTNPGGMGDLSFTSTMADWVTLNGGTLSIDSPLATAPGSRGITVGTNGGTISIGSLGTLTIAGTITGTNTFTKTGVGTLTLTGNSGTSFTGPISVTGGVLAVTAANSLGSTGAAANTTVASGAALQTSTTAAIAEAITLNGTGISSAGALRNTANNKTLSGVITLASSGVRINSDSGTLSLTGGNAGSVADPDLTVGGAGNVTISTVAWNLGSGTLTKDGTGILTLSTDNSATWSGPLNFVQGAVAVANNLALGTGNPLVNVPADSAVNVSGTLSGVTNHLTLNGGGINGTNGALRNTANNNTWSGAISLGGIISRINSDSGTLTLTGGISASGNSLAVGGAGSVTVTTTGISGGGTAALSKDGNGTLSLNVSSTYGGKTTATGGKISVFQDDAMGPAPGSPVPDQLTLSGGSLEGNTTLTLSANRGITLGGTGSGLLALTNTTMTCPNIITGGAALNTGGAGTVALSGVNDYTGGTTVSAGTLFISGSSPVGSGPVTVGAAGTLAGGTSIPNTIAVNGTISPGTSPGVLGTADESWNGGGKYAFQINKADGTAGADPGWDLVNITGGLNVASVLTNKFTITVSTLTSGNVPGDMNGFLNTSNYVWTIAKTTTGITNFDVGAFQINRSAISNNLGAGRLVLGTANSGNDLTVAFVPSNSAPSITVPADQTLNELVPVALTNTASDPDSGSILNFRLVSSPTNMAINANSGIITWTPSESQGPGVYSVTVAVDDDGGTPLSATNSFNITVNELNVAPVFSIFPTNQTITELTTLSNFVTVTDADLPANSLTFSLVAPPAGMTIYPLGAGQAYISWTPAESQGPFTNTITVVITDTNSSAVNSISLSTTNTYTLVVNETNSAPSFTTFPANQTVAANTSTSNYVAGADGDLPANVLTFSLVAPPAGMTITSLGPGQAYILWTTPGIATNAIIRVKIADNGTPAMSVTNTFTINVIDTPSNPVITSVSVVGTTATINWTNAIATRDYSTQYKDNLTDVSWTDVPGGPVTASGVTASQVDTTATSTARYYRVVLLP